MADPEPPPLASSTMQLNMHPPCRSKSLSRKLVLNDRLLEYVVGVYLILPNFTRHSFIAQKKDRRGFPK